MIKSSVYVEGQNLNFVVSYYTRILLSSMSKDTKLIKLCIKLGLILI